MVRISLFFKIFPLFFVMVFGFTNKDSSKPVSSFEPITVLELFTSQGCSSCPSADKLLSQTIADAQLSHKKIYALSFHVDYWNRLGWTDPFSKKAYSERQAAYINTFNLNGAYTPQMIVNGTYQFTGSDKSSLSNAIEKIKKNNALVNFKFLQTTFENNGVLKINFELEGEIENTNINFAVVSAKEITQVKRGENEGSTLVNENVVRFFEEIKAKQKGELLLNITPSFQKNNLTLIAYVQQNSSKKIVGAAMQKL